MKEIFKTGDLTVYSSAYLPLDERMYTLISGGECIVVDPNNDGEQISFLHSIKQKRITVILTHCHYDHISGLNNLQSEFDCTVIGTDICLRNIENPRRNLSRYGNLVYMAHGFSKDEAQDIEPFACHGDVAFEKEHSLDFNGHRMLLKVFPGHSPDSIFIFLDDNIIFTGDNLIPETPTCLDSPGADRGIYNSLTKLFLQSLPGETVVFPAHKDHGLLEDILRTHPDFV